MFQKNEVPFHEKKTCIRLYPNPPLGHSPASQKIQSSTTNPDLARKKYRASASISAGMRPRTAAVLLHVGLQKIPNSTGDPAKHHTTMNG